MSGNQHAYAAHSGLFGHALRQFVRHRDLLWSIYLCNALLTFLRLFAGIYLLNGNPAADTALGLLFSIFMTPLMVLGLNRVLLHVMRGGPVRFFMLLEDLKSGRALVKALAAAVIWQVPAYLMTFLISVNIPRISTLGQVFVALPLITLGIFTWLWLLLRLFPFPYLYITRPQEKLRTLVKASFDLARGKMWRTAMTYLASVWPAALLAICLMFIVDPMISHDTTRAGSLWLFYNGMITISITIVGPYTGLAMAGYASRMMAEGARKE